MTGKHYGQVLMISNAVKQTIVRYDLSFNKSRKKGDCGLSNDGTHISFPISGMELLLIEVLVMMMLFMLPKYLSQK